MKVKSNPPKNLQIHAYLLFYVICNIQIGVGVFSFARTIYLASKHDAWISVIIAGLITHLVMWLIVRMLSKYESSDLYGIHFDLFGKVIGTVFNCMYMLYYLFITMIIMRSYVNVIHAWIFPDIPAWLVIALLSLLTIYAGFGGLRVIVGMCILGFLVIVFTVLLFHSTLEYALWSQLLPIMEYKIPDILYGSFKMSFSLAGFETIMLIYPFIVNKERTMLHTQVAIGFVNIVYITIMTLSIVFFSFNQINRSIWPTLNMLKIAKYPFLERLEFIVIAVWMLMVLTGILLNSWFITRGFKRMWNLNEKTMLVVVIILAFGIALTIKGQATVQKVNEWLGETSFVFSFIYPTLLSLIVALVFKIRKRKGPNRRGGTQ